MKPTTQVTIALTVENLCNNALHLCNNGHHHGRTSGVTRVCSSMQRLRSMAQQLKTHNDVMILDVHAALAAQFLTEIEQHVLSLSLSLPEIEHLVHTRYRQEEHARLRGVVKDGEEEEVVAGKEEEVEEVEVEDEQGEGKGEVYVCVGGEIEEWHRWIDVVIERRALVVCCSVLWRWSGVASVASQLRIAQHLQRRRYDSFPFSCVFAHVPAS